MVNNGVKYNIYSYIYIYVYIMWFTRRSLILLNSSDNRHYSPALLRYDRTTIASVLQSAIPKMYKILKIKKKNI